jgi:hypothetical protein
MAPARSGLLRPRPCTRHRVLRRQPRRLGRAHGHRTLLALHIEGSDARSRGRAGRTFQAHCAAIVTSLANVIVLNFLYHSIGRLDANTHVLLETKFAEAVKSADGDGGRGADVGSSVATDGNRRRLRAGFPIRPRLCRLRRR